MSNNRQIALNRTLALGIIVSCLAVLAIAFAAFLGSDTAYAAEASSQRLVVSAMASTGNASRLVSSQAGTTATQPANDAAIKKLISAYKLTLKKAKKGKGVFRKVYSKGNPRWWIAKYMLYDADKDGTTELFVNAGYSNVNLRWYAFTMIGGKCVYVGSFRSANVALYRGKDSTMYRWYLHNGVSKISRILLKGDVLKTKLMNKDTKKKLGYPRAGKFAHSKKLRLLRTSTASKYTLLKRSATAR